jgi:hypothetical protein
MCVGCGEARFADVRESYPGGALNLQSRLTNAASATQRPQYGSVEVARPPKEYLTSSHREHTTSAGSSNQYEHSPTPFGDCGVHNDSTAVFLSDTLSETASTLRFVVCEYPTFTNS